MPVTHLTSSVLWPSPSKMLFLDQCLFMDFSTQKVYTSFLRSGLHTFLFTLCCIMLCSSSPYGVFTPLKYVLPYLSTPGYILASETGQELFRFLTQHFNHSGLLIILAALILDSSNLGFLWGDQLPRGEYEISH